MGRFVPSQTLVMKPVSLECMASRTIAQNPEICPIFKLVATLLFTYFHSLQLLQITSSLIYYHLVLLVTSQVSF